MIKHADLHIHTYYSDSTSSPEEVVQEASQNNLECIAITDHDTVEGITPTLKAAEKYSLEVITGVELSSEYNNRDIHILGYLFDHKNEMLNDKLKNMQALRVERMKEMIEKLKHLGIDGIKVEEVCSLTKSQSVGRPHLAKVLVEKGHVRHLKDAFDKYLAEGAPAYVSKNKITPQEAIDTIQKAGGIAVLAHPMVTGVDELIPQFVNDGIRGLEVYYPNTPDNIIKFYEGIADKHQLIKTGGSDAHGEAKKNTFIGKSRIPYSIVEQLKSYKKKHLENDGQ